MENVRPFANRSKVVKVCILMSNDVRHLVIKKGIGLVSETWASS